MKSVLVDPPHFYVYQPLGIPTLTAYLRKKGHEVIQKIIDREIYDYFFSSEQMEIILDKIRSGEYSAGSKIPSENTLATQYSIGRPTARQAIDMLVRKGLLSRRRGSLHDR